MSSVKGSLLQDLVHVYQVENETPQLAIDLPKWDSRKQLPKDKMPNCPNCRMDELIMIDADKAKCLVCGVTVGRKE